MSKLMRYLIIITSFAIGFGVGALYKINKAEPRPIQQFQSICEEVGTYIPSKDECQLNWED